jgi:hypothetical protein
MVFAVFFMILTTSHIRIIYCDAMLNMSQHQLPVHQVSFPSPIPAVHYVPPAQVATNSFCAPTPTSKLLFSGTPTPTSQL